jgi:hypothetical protein
MREQKKKKEIVTKEKCKDGEIKYERKTHLMKGRKRKKMKVNFKRRYRGKKDKLGGWESWETESAREKESKKGEAVDDLGLV